MPCAVQTTHTIPMRCAEHGSECSRASRVLRDARRCDGMRGGARPWRELARARSSSRTQRGGCCRESAMA
eukprot:1511101-Rhodomonas_salina.1